VSKIYAALIRHGDYDQLKNTPSALQPFALNIKGQAQAQQGALTLQEIASQLNATFDPQIHSSSLLRAWQTADIFKRHIQQLNHILEVDDLAERSVGSVANLSLDQIEKVIKADPRYEKLPKDWKSDSHFRLPFIGAESLMQAGLRVASHLENTLQTVQTIEGENILKVFIGHGASFRHAAHVLKILGFNDIAKLSMYHAHPVVFEVSAKGNWKQVGGDWKVRKQTDRNVD
jgi:broad specificity phosphatase PhoE